MKGNCYIAPRTDAELDAMFVTQSELNDFATTVNSVDTTLSNSISSLNSTINGLSLSSLSGTLPINKGGTGQTTAANATGTSGLFTTTSTSGSSIKTGNRSDGSYLLRKYGHFVFFSCRLICGGSSVYTPGFTIPSGYRPSSQVRIAVTLRASQSTNGYGDMVINTNGSMNLYTSTGSEAEVCCDTVWWCN